MIAAAMATIAPGAHHDGGEPIRVLGRATMQVSQILKLGRGAVVELDRKVGDPIDVFVNNRLVARGEIVIIEGTRLGITMTEIVKSDRAG
ncbi:MAG: hypothetical protein B7X48_03895 [Acidiphilium sp. 34-60-192]|nr:MAG: hypothetical protein B7X48_03895 [Acidiphilium sp. 34-60-192]